MKFRSSRFRDEIPHRSPPARRRTVSSTAAARTRPPRRQPFDATSVRRASVQGRRLEKCTTRSVSRTPAPREPRDSPRRRAARRTRVPGRPANAPGPPRRDGPGRDALPANRGHDIEAFEKRDRRALGAVDRVVAKRRLEEPDGEVRGSAFFGGGHCPSGGSHSSTLLPSGSMTQPNLPYPESSVFSRTSQPSSRSARSRVVRSATR